MHLTPLSAFSRPETSSPIINENDTVAVEELRFGDNDRLSAEVAQLVNANLLLLVTSSDGLTDSDGRRIARAGTSRKSCQYVRPDKGEMSVGGMRAKLQAVDFALSHGISAFILDGRKPGQIAAASTGARRRHAIPGDRCRRLQREGSDLNAIMSVQVAVIARNTFTDLVRQKVFYIILVFAMCAIGSSVFMARLTFQEEFQMLKDVCLGAMSIFTSLLAILATANFLPRDLEDRTLYNLLSKPVPRFVYLLGKLAGIILLLLLFTLLMSAVFCLVLWMRERSVLSQTRSEFAESTPEELATALKAVTEAAAFNANLIPGILIIFVKSVLLASLTLFISTFATSCAFHRHDCSGRILHRSSAVDGRESTGCRESISSGGRTSLSLSWPCSFPDLQSFNLTDDVIAGAAIPAGTFSSRHSPWAGSIRPCILPFLPWSLQDESYDPQDDRRRVARYLRNPQDPR